MDINILKNIIRVGIVSSVNQENGTVQVIFQDKDEMISNDLPLLNREYDMPQIKEPVLCIFLPNDIQQGFCLLGFYSTINQPPIKNKDIYYKKFGDGTNIQYDKKAKILTINATNEIIINGDININGKITSNEAEIQKLTSPDIQAENVTADKFTEI